MRNDYKIDDSEGTPITDPDGMSEILYYLKVCREARIEQAKKDAISSKILCGVSTMLAVVAMGIAGRCALQVRYPNVSPDTRFVEKIQEFENTEYYQQFKQQYFENNDATLSADNINTNMLQNSDTSEYQNEKEKDAQRAGGICGIASMGVLAVASLIVAKEAGDTADHINKYIQYEEKRNEEAQASSSRLLEYIKSKDVAIAPLDSASLNNSIDNETTTNDGAEKNKSTTTDYCDIAKENDETHDSINEKENDTKAIVCAEEKESNKTSVVRDKENKDALNELDCDTDKENERW